MLKNYTSGIAALKSIGEIERLLATHGAKKVMTDFDTDHEPVTISFMVPTVQGDVGFRLPANIPAVNKILKNPKYSHHKGKASDVAWSIIKDWIDAQLAIIETEMVTIEQVFLPYMLMKDDRTLYEAVVSRGFLLSEGKG